jgi:hypothetical protein
MAGGSMSKKLVEWYREYHLKTGQVINEYLIGMGADGGPYEIITEEDEQQIAHRMEDHTTVTIADFPKPTPGVPTEPLAVWVVRCDEIVAVRQYMVERDEETT